METTPEDYTGDSWEFYRDTVARHAGPDGPQSPDYGAYLPNPDEIKWRGAVVCWLSRNGFSNDFADSVMIHDTPPIQTVLRQWNKGHSREEIEARWADVIRKGE